MFSLNDSIRYWLYSEPADMRMGFNGLGGLVANRMGGNILGGDAFCFLNRRRNLLKILRWEPGGLVMYSKRLEKGTFKPPRDSWGKGALGHGMERPGRDGGRDKGTPGRAQDPVQPRHACKYKNKRVNIRG